MDKREVALQILLSLIDHNVFFAPNDKDQDADIAENYARLYNSIYENLCLER